MRQQFKQEEPAKTTNISPRIMPENHTSENSMITGQVVTTTKSSIRKWQGWPFLAIGVFLIASAGIAFFISMDFLRDSPEVTLRVDQTLGMNSLTNFFVLFFTLSQNLIVATIYVLYGLWLRKHGASGRLPAFLAFYRKRIEQRKNSQPIKEQDLVKSAWIFRIFIILMMGMSTYASLLPHFTRYSLPINLHSLVTTANSILNSVGLFGLLLILADTIYPLCGRKKSE